MMRWLFCLALALASAIPAAAQLPPDKALAALKPTDGFQVELFAAEPMLLNPTSIDVDHKGRVWVAEAVNYRRVGFGRPIIRPEGDRIVVLVDKNGDGKADESVVFYQGKDLYGPLGVCVAPQADGKALKVFVCQSPDILVFEDKDGDLKADGPPKKFLTGFGGFDHDHGVHGLNIGPDGRLYFTVGDAGVTGLQSSDGTGRKWKSNDTDVQKGTVWRCDMDGKNLELIAHNFRNNYECCVDSFGEVWLSDNDDDGNQQTRICFVMPGGNYGYGPRGPGQTHWHEEQPGIVHKTLRTGFGSPTGITFYEGSLLPEKYRGALLHCDAGPREVRAFFRKPKGAGYELDKEVILTSSDNWFRPSDVCVAPDGSIFVADWYDRGVGGHGMGDPTDGRIYRLTPKGHKGYTVPEVKLDTKEGVLAALGSPCQATRALALAKLDSMKPLQAGTMMFDSCLQYDDEQLRARASQAFMLSVARADRKKESDKDWDDMPYKVGRAIFKMPDSRARCFAVRLLDNYQHDNPKTLSAFSDIAIKFGHPAVLREILLAMRNQNSEATKTLVLIAAKQYDGKDIFYRAALNIACGTDPKRRDLILADFDEYFPEWNDTVADLVWELRPKSVLPRLERLLGDAKLTGPQKARIVDILAASDDPAAGQTMLAVLKSDVPAEVKARAIDSLRLFLPTKWKALQGSKDLSAAVDALMADAKTQPTGLRLIAAANAADRVPAVVKIAADKKAAPDLRKAAVQTLGAVRGQESANALGDLLSEVEDNALEAAVVAALGNQITGQAKDPGSTLALKILQKLVTEKSEVLADIKPAAVESLAGTRAGTGWLLDLHAKKQLPAELVGPAGRLLRNSPFAGERNKALLLFPAPGKLDPKKLPALAVLAKRTGDPARGKQVWDASLAGAAQCAKCHTVRGVGGQVGPDLSMIGKKGSRENIFESILDPSKAIADQYLQVSVTTAAGVTVTGLPVADTPQAITLRDANGKDTVIPRADIDGPVRKLKVSIMPQDIVAGLTEDELIDLVSYLQTLQTAALTPDSFRVVGPFPAAGMAEALGKEFGPEAVPFDAALKFRAGDKMLPWGTIRPDAKGYFDLMALHGTTGTNSASYMYAEVESPADQDAELLLGTDDGTKLWVNGKMLFTHSKAVAAAPGQDKVPLKLKKGTNTVLLKVANGNNPHGFYFTLLTKDEVKAK
jgi:putative membrane-bound dehydrogenase-like protein